MKYLLLLGAVFFISCGSNNANTTKKPETSATPQPAPVATNTANNNVPSAPVAATPVPQPPIVTIGGLQKGNQYNVDGPLWYDGTAIVDELNSSELRINITIAAPAVGMPYQLKDGKVNVTIKLIKDSEYKLYLIDGYGNKTYWVPNVTFETGKTAASWFSPAKDYAKINASTQYYEFDVNDDKSIYISSNAMPGGLTLTKK